MKHIFVGQNIREPVNYSSILSDEIAINFFPWKTLRAKIKVHTFFL